MTTQLRLIDPTEVDWRLDERTKAIGRKGIEQARAALRAARAPLPADPTAATQAMTARIEAQIRRVPEQWVWMHRRWRRQPDPATG